MDDLSKLKHESSFSINILTIVVDTHIPAPIVALIAIEAAYDTLLNISFLSSSNRAILSSSDI